MTDMGIQEGVQNTISTTGRKILNKNNLKFITSIVYNGGQYALSNILSKFSDYIKNNKIANTITYDVDKNEYKENVLPKLNKEIKEYPIDPKMEIEIGKALERNNISYEMKKISENLTNLCVKSDDVEKVMKAMKELSIELENKDLKEDKKEILIDPRDELEMAKIFEKHELKYRVEKANDSRIKLYIMGENKEIVARALEEASEKIKLKNKNRNLEPYSVKKEKAEKALSEEIENNTSKQMVKEKSKNMDISR